MAVLDTFYLIFKSDTSDLKKGAEEAERVTKKLDSSLQSVGKQTEHLGGSFLAMAKSAKALLLSAIPVGFATLGIQKALEFGVELSKTSRLLNVNIEDLNAWRNAIELTGGSAGQFQGTLTSLAAKFGTSSEVVLRLLPKYADALSKLSPSRAQQIGKNLGLDESTILLLQHGRREVEAMIKSQKELGVVTQKDAGQFLLYNEATTKVKQSTQALFTVLALEALPYLIKFYDILSKGISYFVQHKDFVIGGLIGITAATTAMGIAFGIANLPIVLMAGLIVGLISLFALVYDDIRAFQKGQKSLIGYLVNHYPVAAQVIKSAFDVMGKAAHYLLHPLELILNALAEIEYLIDRVFHGGKRELQLNINHGNDVVRESGHSILPIIPGLGQSNEGTKNTLTTGDITINTHATDPKWIANSFIGELLQQYSQASNYYADGVRA